MSEVIDFLISPETSWEYRNISIGVCQYIIDYANKNNKNCKFLLFDKKNVNYKSIPDVLKIFPSNIDETIDLLKIANLNIVPDSFIMHLCINSGANFHALFGPSNFQYIIPKIYWNQVSKLDFICSPCSQTRCVNPKNNCMNFDDFSIHKILSNNIL